MLFDTNNPVAWDPGPHGQHLAMGTIVQTCGYCVRSCAAGPAPSAEALDLATRAFKKARELDLAWVEQRCHTEEQRGWVRQWPGEHYRLLSGIVRTVRPSLVVEVGTFTGMGTLALLDGLLNCGGNGALVTYDVVAWDAFTETLLRGEDFLHAEQRLGDLAEPSYFASQGETLARAELIFVDGPKDGRFEPIFFPKLLELLRGSHHIVMADDIHFLHMVRLWQSLGADRVDLTSFGHWSGTGLLLTS